MDKFNKYNNELTIYINKLVGENISDLVGDIVGDIISADIPTNIPEGDTTIEVITPLGNMTVRYYTLGFNAYLIFNRIIGGVIYEEHIIDLLELFDNPISRGYILEKRNRGIILTKMEKVYDKSPVSEINRIISNEETKSICSYEELRKILNDNIDDIIFKHNPFSIRELFYAMEGKTIKRPMWIHVVQDVLPFAIESAKKEDEIEPSYSVKMLINKYYDHYQQYYYHVLEGEKLIERVSDLIHGSINSESIKDIKTLIEWYKTSNDHFYKKERLFDLFNQSPLDIWQNYQKGTFNELSEHYLGPSKVKMSEYYYDYLKYLISTNFSLSLPEENQSALSLYQSLIKKYQE